MSDQWLEWRLVFWLTVLYYFHLPPKKKKLCLTSNCFQMEAYVWAGCWVWNKWLILDRWDSQMLSICFQGQCLGLNRSQMSWIPELVPCCMFSLVPKPPLNRRKEGEPRLTDFAFHIFLFGRGRWGNSWCYSWAGAGCVLGVGCSLEEKSPGRICNHLLQACKALCLLTFLHCFTADSLDLAPTRRKCPAVSWLITKTEPS